MHAGLSAALSSRSMIVSRGGRPELPVAIRAGIVAMVMAASAERQDYVGAQAAVGLLEHRLEILLRGLKAIAVRLGNMN